MDGAVQGGSALLFCVRDLGNGVLRIEGARVVDEPLPSWDSPAPVCELFGEVGDLAGFALQSTDKVYQFASPVRGFARRVSAGLTEFCFRVVSMCWPALAVV